MTNTQNEYKIYSYRDIGEGLKICADGAEGECKLDDDKKAWLAILGMVLLLVLFFIAWRYISCFPAYIVAISAILLVGIILRLLVS